MVGYILFLGFLAVFAVFYLARDKTQDAKKIRNCDLW